MIAVHCPSSSSYLLTAFWQGAKNVVPKKLTAIMAGLFCAQNKLFLMFVRLKKVKDPKGKIHIYEQLVESYRVHGKIKQKVVMTLGKKGEVSADRIQNIIRILIKKDPTLELVRKWFLC